MFIARLPCRFRLDGYFSAESVEGGAESLEQRGVTGGRERSRPGVAEQQDGGADLIGAVPAVGALPEVGLDGCSELGGEIALEIAGEVFEDLASRSGRVAVSAVGTVPGVAAGSPILPAPRTVVLAPSVIMTGVHPTFSSR